MSKRGRETVVLVSSGHTEPNPKTTKFCSIPNDGAGWVPSLVNCRSTWEKVARIAVANDGSKNKDTRRTLPASCDGCDRAPPLIAYRCKMADRNLCENCFSKLADHERKMYVGVNNMIPSSLTGDGAPTKTEAHTPTQCSKASFRKPSTPPIEETEPPTAGTADGTAAAFLSNIQKHHQQAAAPPQQVVPRQQPAKVNPAASHSEDEGIPFNPYLFMKLLPPYNDIRKRCDIVLPVKSKGDSRKTLVLDLDETLVHCSVGRMDNADLRFPVQFNGVEYEINARKRPHMVEFLDCVSQHFEVVVFTASQEVYARRLLDLIDPEGKYVHHRLYRDSCMPVCGNYLKDLNCLGRDLSQVLLVDNSPHAFGYQVDNGVPIMSWFDDTSDKELLSLLPFLDRILGAEDVRIPIRNQFKTQAIINEQQEVGYGQHTRADLHGSV